MRKIQQDKLYTTVQVAKYLGLNARTLETWRRRNTFPQLRAIRVGSRKIKYKGADVLAFVGEGSAS